MPAVTPLAAKVTAIVPELRAVAVAVASPVTVRVCPPAMASVIPKPAMVVGLPVMLAQEVAPPRLLIVTPFAVHVRLMPDPSVIEKMSPGALAAILMFVPSLISAKL